MAVAIPLELLDREQQETIFKCLRLRVKPNWFQMKQQRYRKGAQDPPIQFYEIHGSEVLVPFLFSRCLKLSMLLDPAQLAGLVANQGQTNQMRETGRLSENNLQNRIYQIQNGNRMETRIYLPDHLGSRPNGLKEYIKCDLRFTGQLREVQIPVVQEAVRQLDNISAVNIGCPPGFGKTIIGAYLACHYGLMVSIILHRKTLLTQWKNTFEKVTNAVVWIAGTKIPPKLRPNVVIFMASQVVKFPAEYLQSFGILILDESHCLCTRSYVEKILSFTPKYIIAESATLKRTDGMESMIHCLTGTNEIKVNLQKKFTVYKVETGVEISPDNSSDWHALKKATFYNEEINKIIIDLALYNLDRKILILSLEVAHVMLLYERLKQIGEQGYSKAPDQLPRRFTVDFMCSTKKSYKDSNILISTCSKVGVGFDEAAFCSDFNGIPINLLILTGSIKEPGTLEQNVGRCFRSEEPVIFDLVSDNRILQSHYRQRKKWYIAKGGTLQTLTMKKDTQEKEETGDDSLLSENEKDDDEDLEDLLPDDVGSEYPDDVEPDQYPDD